MNCVRTIVLPVDINTEGCLQTYTAGLSMLLGAIGGEFSSITAWTNELKRHHALNVVFTGV